MKEKIQAAIKDMRTKVGRDSEHIYRLTETGEMIQGVSTVSSIVPKDWLAAYGAKEAVKALGYNEHGDMTVAEEMFSKITECEGLDQYIQILKEAKGAHARKSKKALVDGRLGHAWLESFVEARINGSTLPFVPLNTPLERPLTQFLAWEALEVNYWIASEAFVVRPDKFYAGQLDAICVLKTGELCLVDFKFATNLSEEYYLQTAGYAYTFEPYSISFDKRLIIRLPKTLEREEWDVKEHKYKKIPNNIEVYEVKTPYIGDVQAFCAALVVKAWINKYVNK